MKPLTCFACEYDFTGLPEVGRCPECGCAYGNPPSVKAAYRGARGFSMRIFLTQMAAIVVGFLGYIALLRIVTPYATQATFVYVTMGVLFVYMGYLVGVALLLPRLMRRLEPINIAFDLRLGFTPEGLSIMVRRDGALSTIVPWSRIRDIEIVPHRRRPNEYELRCRMRVTKRLNWWMRIIYVIEANEALAREVEQTARALTTQPPESPEPPDTPDTPPNASDVRERDDSTTSAARDHST